MNTKTSDGAVTTGQHEDTEPILWNASSKEQDEKRTALQNASQVVAAEIILDPVPQRDTPRDALPAAPKVADKRETPSDKEPASTERVDDLPQEPTLQPTNPSSSHRDVHATAA